jgi:hypothetical protein
MRRPRARAAHADDVAAAEVAAEQVFVDTVYVRLEEAAKQHRRWLGRAMPGAGSVTREAWSNATPWSSRRPSGSRRWTPHTRVSCSADSICSMETPDTSGDSVCATPSATCC